jgi:hypothetical protein
MNKDIATLEKENAMLIEALGSLIHKIDAEEWKGQPLHSKGHPDCPWLKDWGYPCEYSIARQLLARLLADEATRLEAQ